YECVLHHRDGRVAGWDVDPLRTPWSPCAGSATQLDELIGTPLSTSTLASAAGLDVRQQCTHLFDLALLTISHAARGIAERHYDATVPDWTEPPFAATLDRDGRRMLRWELGTTAEITAPPGFAGVSLRGGFLAWSEQRLHPDLAEAAQVLRRAVWLSPARLIDLEGCDDAIESSLTPGVCWTAQPERITLAPRVRHSLRDHGPSADGMLAGFDERARGTRTAR
ncbi:MAG: hypothetical protein KDB21_09220, partial [Acidimicrobiales bacterium]|nr:hypothetical protein [Acidimicrobiales bacterium]